MDALVEQLAERPHPRLAQRLSAELDRLEVEVYRTLSIRGAAAELAATARGAGLTALGIRAELLASDAASRAGGADAELVVQRGLLAEAQAAGFAEVVRRASTYLASTCDRLGRREDTIAYAYAGLSAYDARAAGDLTAPRSWAERASPVVPGEAPSWRAEALMVVVLMSMSRPGADVTLMDRAVDIVRRDCRPALVAATEANFAEMAAVVGRPDVAARFADAATTTIARHDDAEAVLTWESIAVARLACNDLQRAEAALQRALEIEPVLGVSDSNGDPWLTFAELCLRDGRPEDGLRVLDAPRRPTPMSSWVSSRDLKVRAELHAARGEWQTAYQTLERHLAAYEQIRSVEGDRDVIRVESRVSVDEERQRSREFQQLALTDPLTGVANRRAVEQWLDRASVAGRTASTVAIVDADHFKSVNDRFSHEVGDRVLERLASCLVAVADTDLGSPHLVGRLGGEEFVVVWPSATAEAGMVGAEQIRAGVAALPMGDLAPGLAVTVSVGAAFVDDPNELQGSPRVALQRADVALYLAKDAGRNAARAG